ncbi:2,3-butanediol dehydrogenase [Hazenella coriacea]|uniref:(R,R)-butanediol dehydrogenase/meso-butanediol dehydrogenase/diacetyl reductase n=1 Tax=Hazenella coriacea TaxID=1179467 RepID=A0A4R3L3S1_9BACL|nr:2,3-butanediol dehydrogenase [Hazenella coriacea]TCS92404.1 (R,R)-butanediol dehydrogenase/meso-butanediol dehydrogenase/diacetyl reductase [Hazenella coriacea]
MKAARWYGPKDIRVEDIPEPQIKPGFVKISVEWCGICGSDLHEYLAGPIFIPGDEPHPLSGEKAPIVMGHEFAGEVIEIGEGVQKVKVGDRVTVEPILNCGTCAACRSGRYNICEWIGFHGLAGGGGGFSEVTMVKEHMVHKIPDHMTYEQGALVEPTAVALHAVRQSQVRAGDSCAVFGTGPIGLSVIQCLKAAGATNIIAVEISAERQQKAKELGATHIINPLKANTVDVIREITKDGVDVCFEVAGVEATLASAMDSVKFGGQVLIVSIWEKKAAIAPNNLVIKETNMKGTLAYRNIFPAVIQLISERKIEAEKMITKKINLDQIVDEGFEALVQSKSQVKILVKPR